MCKHVAAVLYGIGARFDEHPELLFRLHEVNEEELIAKAGSALPLAKEGPGRAKVLASDDLSEIFGLEMAPSAASTRAKPKTQKAWAAAASAGQGTPGKARAVSKSRKVSKPGA
jgi:uncharacterized Zn finger protein